MGENLLSTAADQSNTRVPVPFCLVVVQPIRTSVVRLWVCGLWWDHITAVYNLTRVRYAILCVCVVGGVGVILDTVLEDAIGFAARTMIGSAVRMSSHSNCMCGSSGRRAS